MGRSKAGVFRNVRAENLSAALVKALLARNPAVKPNQIEDVIWGCVQQTLEQGFNIARQISLLAGLPHEVSGQTVNRLCGSSMTAIHAAVGAINSGVGDLYICGGVEHMGHVPMDYNFDGNPELSLNTAKAAAMMGLTAEMLATTFQISRKAQDEFALASHQRATKARAEGTFKDELVPLAGHDADGLPLLVDYDEVVRTTASFEDLSKLKPVFNPKGSVTAGNSSALSDGASAVLVMSADKAKSLGLKPLAKIRAMASAGCDPSTMGRGPVPASKKALEQYFELNEAFAAQSLAVLTEMKLLDRMDHINIKGGAIALGHPLGCSGARITGALAHILNQKDAQFGLATMCIGMGQGVATVLERVH
jgi:acetyl-CoA acyltransferase